MTAPDNTVIATWQKSVTARILRAHLCPSPFTFIRPLTRSLSQYFFTTYAVPGFV